jgi:hypothetical protein
VQFEAKAARPKYRAATAFVNDRHLPLMADEVTPMAALFGFFNGPYGSMMASVVVFVTFFLVARLAHARQGVALAFAFAPLLIIFALETAVSAFA